MKILGIHGDFHNPQKQVFESNASIVIDGEIMVAVSEERLTRKKLDGTFPWLAIDECLRIANLSIEEIDEVVVSSLSPKKNAMRYLKCTLSTFLDTGVLVRNKDKISVNLRPLIKGMFKSGGKGFSLKGREHVSFPIKYYDHHYAHAAGAFYCSPFDDALVITLDGGGNGLDGGAYIGNGTSLKRFLEVPHFQSPGTMYSAITYDLGFKRHRHEGKITGLAAYGKPQRDEMGLKNLLRYDVNKKRFVSKAIAKQSKDLYSKSDFFFSAT